MGRNISYTLNNFVCEIWLNRVMMKPNVVKVKTI